MSRTAELDRAGGPPGQGADGVSVLTTSSGAERLALRIVQLGALAAVLAASTYKVFELDRFFVPKELVLHAVALLAGLLTVAAFRRVAFTRVDLLLLGFLVLGALSAGLATNPWTAARALAISVSGVALFWAARALKESGLARPLLAGLALAVVVGAATSLLQTYGVRTELFSLNRAPGGTLGNRNFIAHMAAFGLPLVLLAALRAWRTAGYLLWAVGVVLVAATLVLTRSRAGWLAFGAVMLVFLVAMLFSRPLRRHGGTWLRLSGIVLLAGAGVAGALMTPNTLRWRGENPYLESMRGVANYQEGSGQGRLVQYRRSLAMAADAPLLGVGPGNWAVRYPEYAAADDPSLDRGAPGTTSNPWPSSDWVALVAERGLPAAVLLVLAFLGIAAAGIRRLVGARDADEGLSAAALLGTLAAAVVAGAFDAVLLLALPTLLVWAALGALWTPSVREGPVARVPQTIVLVLVALVAGAGAARSAGQMAAIVLSATRTDTAALERAARFDPGNYRVRLRLARSGSREERCRHALAAHALYPSAHAARDRSRGCDGRAESEFAR
jgi:O-antigen ligase